MSIIQFEEWMVRERFVETGSYEGDTLALAARLPFVRLDGIEIDAALGTRCRRRFATVWSRISIHVGSSPAVLREILVDRPTTFWLDAHFTGLSDHRHLMDASIGECPLLQELEVITRFPWTVRPIVLIDDVHIFREAFWSTEYARNFRRADWPTLQQVEAQLTGYDVQVGERVLCAR